MTDKSFNGKAIYNPKGKAGEYSQWACNFYVGCSNNCDYCYCKRRVLGKLWSDKPTLKKCFKDEHHAMEVFRKELKQNLDELRKSGLFFTFTSDPMLPETNYLNWRAISEALWMNVPVQILTKRADSFSDLIFTRSARSKIAFGFTLTGHDELERGASTNMERIHAMKELHENGFKTFASIEPIVDFAASTSMIQLTYGSCDLYKVGLMSGRTYSASERNDARRMLDYLKGMTDAKFYLKDSLVALLGVDRNVLPPHFVSRDYNIFEN